MPDIPWDEHEILEELLEYVTNAWPQHQIKSEPSAAWLLNCTVRLNVLVLVSIISNFDID